jgi:Spy/CpxP family protein refolding chaperone
METTQSPTPPAGGDSSPQQDKPSRYARCHEAGAEYHGYRRHRGGRVLLALVVGLAAGIAGGYIGKSFAQGMGPMHMSAGAMADPARMDEQVRRMVRHFAVETDASPEQQDKLTTIVKGAISDLAPLRAQMRAQREEGLRLLRADHVDRDAVERLRAEQMRLADGMSRRVSTALADAADVLTPQQRQKIAGRLEEWMQRGGRFGAWHAGADSSGPAGTGAPAGKGST